jgi:hypothetical protein
MASVLSDTQIEQFREQGYAIAEDVFDPAVDFRALKSDYSEILDRVADEMRDAGTIQTYDAQAPFGDRLIDVQRQAGSLSLQPFDISLPQKHLTAETPVYLGKAAFDLLTHPPLLDIVEKLIGPEVYSNPVQHIRMKVPAPASPTDGGPPGTGIPDAATTTPWHQDIGVVTEDADATEMLTVWVAVTDASVASGCLTIVPATHLNGIVGHCPGVPSLTIPDALVPEDAAIPVPLRAGSALILSRHTMHCARANTTTAIRWSFDLRYQPTGQPTGRSWFPGFVARSRANPASVLSDHTAWASLWERARRRMLDSDPAELRFNRWSPDAPWCA